MKWSFKIFKIFGIPIKVHISFLLLIFVLLYFFVSSGLGSFLFSLFWIIAIFTVVILHELAHSIVGRLFGYKVEDITLLPIGGMARMKDIPEKPIAEILVAVSGPMINIIIGLLGLLVFSLIYGKAFLMDMDFESYTFPRMFISFNFIMAIFNLLPIFPMDGGRVLRGILAIFFNYSKSTHIAAEVGRVLAIMMVVIAIFFKQYWIALIGVFIFFGSKQEEQMFTLRHILSNYKVADLFKRNITTLTKENMIFEVSDLIVNSTQEYYPIIEGEVVIGIIQREQIFKRFYEGDLRVKLEEIISDKFLTIKETDDLFKAFIALAEKHAKLGVIYQNGAFAGIITMHEINNIYQLMKK